MYVPRAGEPRKTLLNGELPEIRTIVFEMENTKVGVDCKLDIKREKIASLTSIKVNQSGIYTVLRNLPCRLWWELEPLRRPLRLNPSASCAQSGEPGAVLQDPTLSVERLTFINPMPLRHVKGQIAGHPTSPVSHIDQGIPPSSCQRAELTSVLVPLCNKAELLKS